MADERENEATESTEAERICPSCELARPASAFRSPHPRTHCDVCRDAKAKPAAAVTPTPTPPDENPASPASDFGDVVSPAAADALEDLRTKIQRDQESLRNQRAGTGAESGFARKVRAALRALHGVSIDEVPDACPITGASLRGPGAVAFVAIDPALGMVDGNVAAVSPRAARVLGDATADELEFAGAWRRERVGG